MESAEYQATFISTPAQLEVQDVSGEGNVQVQLKVGRIRDLWQLPGGRMRAVDGLGGTCVRSEHRACDSDIDGCPSR